MCRHYVSIPKNWIIICIAAILDTNALAARYFLLISFGEQFKLFGPILEKSMKVSIQNKSKIKPEYEAGILFLLFLEEALKTLIKKTCDFLLNYLHFFTNEKKIHF